MDEEEKVIAGLVYVFHSISYDRDDPSAQVQPRNRFVV